MQIAPYATIATPDGPWRISDTGSGMAVVLLHGFPDTPQSWTGVASSLVDVGHRVVIPYLPGYHPESMLEGPPRSTTEIAELLVSLLDTLQIDRAVVVGHDWGADIAYRAAATAPHRIAGLVPIAIPHPASVRVSPRLLWRIRHFINLRVPPTAPRVRRNDFRYIEVLYERWAPDWFGLEREAALARAKAAFRDPAVLEAAIGYYKTVSVLGGDNRFVLSGPALVVAGEKDMIPLRAFETTVGRWDGDADLLVVSGAGHWPHREDEPQFVAALTKFVDGIDR